MRSGYKKLGDLIEVTDVQNTDGNVGILIGLSIDKCFISSVANTVGTDLTKYKIIRKNEFAVSLMQVSRDEKVPVACQKEYDVAINCSKCEAFGRVTVEYMTAELCVIAANTGANEELIEDGFNGLIYNYDSDKDLCEKILYVKNNRKIINVLGKNAHKKVKEKFSKQRNSNEIVKIYKETKE